jgi:hypothetical protein
MENGLNGTLWNASFAINAFVRMDVQHPFTFVEALNGTNNDAIGIPTAIAGFCYNVSHLGWTFLVWNSVATQQTPASKKHLIDYRLIA